MPTAGTHITILERLAFSGEFADAIGDLGAQDDTDAARLLKFAKLGAIGPDIFYALADYGSGIQDFTNFLAKLAGSYECITKLTADIDQKVSDVEAGITLGTSQIFQQALDEFQQTFGLLTALIHEGLIAALIEQGFDFFPTFEARRQQNRPRKDWFWADYLHYVKSGAFARELFVQGSGKPNVRAFAYGYLSHYVTDVVGHPFVNQVVGAPWRLYWQRHHLVENFIDSEVWPRWHDSHEDEVNPQGGEPPLDRHRSSPNPPGIGARYTYARLNDHINIGYDQGNDPIDAFIKDICRKIRANLEDMGVLEVVPGGPDDLNEWADAMAAAFRAVYQTTDQPPENLKGRGRQDGYPTADDIKEAYSVLRLYLKVATEEKLTEPEFPDITGDVLKAVKKLWDDVQNSPGKMPPIPRVGVPGSFEDLWAALKAFISWAVKVEIAIAAAAFQLIRDAIGVADVLLVDTIRAGLFLIKKALFNIYRYFRHFLVRSAYAMPFTNELDEDLGGGVSARTLWRTPAETILYSYPKEELVALERAKTDSHYVPWVPPERLSEMSPPNHILLEQPQTWVGPYGNGVGPEAFIEAPIGQRDLLSRAGPMPLNVLVVPGQTFVPPADFGGAVINCAVAFRKVAAAEKNGHIPTDIFPDYNLDGDRGYAWPCWDVRNPPGLGTPFDSLEPPAGGTVIVDPVEIR